MKKNKILLFIAIFSFISVLYFIIYNISVVPTTPTEKKNIVTPAKEFQPLSLENLPSHFYCTNFAVYKNSLFFSGTTNENERKAYCLDLQTQNINEISFRTEGSIFDISISDRGNGLFTMCSSRRDNTGIPIIIFTLCEVSPIHGETRAIELNGINKVNLLAIGTPIINGCVTIGNYILIIVNNRILLLDESGALKDYIIYESGFPHIGGVVDNSALIYSYDQNRLSVQLVSITEKDTICLESVDLQEDFSGILPSYSDNKLYVLEDRDIYELDLRKNISLLYGRLPSYNLEAKLCTNGETIIECDRGNLRVFRCVKQDAIK